MNDEAVFMFPLQFVSNVAVVNIGEEFGADGPAVLIALMCKAGEGNTGRVRGSYEWLGKRSFTTEETARRVLDSAERYGLLVIADKNESAFSVRLLSSLFKHPRRPQLPRRVREFVMKRDGRICGICGEEIPPNEAVHIDHIYPWSKGGPDLPFNLQVAHGTCNSRKGARV